MAPRIFSSKQREGLDAFPDLVTHEDRERFFRFSDLDRRFVDRFGVGAVDVALMLGSLRMLGFIPGSLDASAELIDYQALYVEGRGGLERELVGCLRRGRALRVGV